MKRKGIIILLLLFAAWLDPYKDRMREGNSLYNDAKYPQADAAYQSAEEFIPSEKERPYIAFNMGDAKYKAQDYEGAISQFQAALDTDDEELQKRSFLNLGNAYYQKGDKEKALESWMNALKIDPEYTKAQMNIEKLFQEDEQKQQQEQKKKEQNKSENEEKKDENSSQGEQQNSQGPQNNEEANSPEHKQGDPIEQKLSKEQIENLLQQFKARPLQRKDGDAKTGGRALENEW